jgi:hypothetical protein
MLVFKCKNREFAVGMICRVVVLLFFKFAGLLSDGGGDIETYCLYNSV